MIFTSTAFANDADRYQWFSSNNFTSFFFDTQSMIKSENKEGNRIFTVWFKTTYNGDGVKKFIASKKNTSDVTKYETLKYSLERWQFNTADRTYRIMDIYHNNDSTILYEYNDANPVWKGISPGSTTEAWYNAVTEYAKTDPARFY